MEEHYRSARLILVKVLQHASRAGVTKFWGNGWQKLAKHWQKIGKSHLDCTIVDVCRRLKLGVFGGAFLRGAFLRKYV
jgi:hypothetical protein